MAQTLGSKIFAARKAKGLTQEQLAVAIGVTSRWVREYEKERFANPTLSRLRKLSRVLGIPLADLIRSKGPGTAEASS